MGFNLWNPDEKHLAAELVDHEGLDVHEKMGHPLAFLPSSLMVDIFSIP